MSKLCWGSATVQIHITRRLWVRPLRLSWYLLPQQSTCFVRDIKATDYQAARSLPSVAVDELWRTFHFYWIDCYFSHPDIVARDVRKHFVARTFEEHARTLAVNIKSITVEASHSMSVVKRYNSQVRKANQKVKLEVSDLNHDATLHIALKDVSDSDCTIRPLTTLLVYSALPIVGLFSYPPAPSVYARARAMQKNIAEISKYGATDHTFVPMF